MKTVDGYRLTRAGLDDTSPEAHRVLADVWRRMPLSRKAETVASLFDLATQQFRIAHRRRGPALTDSDAHRLWLAQYCPELPERERMRAELT